MYRGGSPPESSLRLDFRMESTATRPPIHQAQQAVLDTFPSISTQPGFVQIGGEVDKAYADEVLSETMPTIYWWRAVTWDLHELVYSIEQLAKTALFSGRDQAAAELHEHRKALINKAINENDQLFNIDGFEFRISSCHEKSSAS